MGASVIYASLLEKAMILNRVCQQRLRVVPVIKNIADLDAYVKAWRSLASARLHYTAENLNVCLSVSA